MSHGFEPAISITMITEANGTLATPAKNPPMPTMSAATGSGDRPGIWSDANLPNAAPSARAITPPLVAVRPRHVIHAMAIKNAMVIAAVNTTV